MKWVHIFYYTHHIQCIFYFILFVEQLDQIKGLLKLTRNEKRNFWHFDLITKMTILALIFFPIDNKIKTFLPAKQFQRNSVTFHCYEITKNQNTYEDNSEILPS